MLVVKCSRRSTLLLPPSRPPVAARGLGVGLALGLVRPGEDGGRSWAVGEGACGAAVGMRMDGWCEAVLLQC